MVGHLIKWPRGNQWGPSPIAGVEQTPVLNAMPAETTERGIILVETGLGLPCVEFNNRLNVVGNLFTQMSLKMNGHPNADQPPSNPPVPAPGTTVLPFVRAHHLSRVDLSSLSLPASN